MITKKLFFILISSVALSAPLHIHSAFQDSSSFHSDFEEETTPNETSYSQTTSDAISSTTKKAGIIAAATAALGGAYSYCTSWLANNNQQAPQTTESEGGFSFGISIGDEENINRQTSPSTQAQLEPYEVTTTDCIIAGTFMAAYVGTVLYVLYQDYKKSKQQGSPCDCLCCQERLQSPDDTTKKELYFCDCECCSDQCECKKDNELYQKHCNEEAHINGETL